MAGKDLWMAEAETVSLKLVVARKWMALRKRCQTAGFMLISSWRAVTSAVQMAGRRAAHCCLAGPWGAPVGAFVGGSVVESLLSG